MTIVTIIDYGVGNLLSVANAVEHCGADVRVSDRYQHVSDADILVLPGVGAFADAMKQLKRNGLDEAIKEFSLKERPFMGICLGMQMMLEGSEEFGTHQGIGLIKGKVVPIESHDENGIPHKIPHIGWAPIVPAGSRQWSETVLHYTAVNTPFYFVHSYTAVPESNTNRLADTNYNGRLVSAAIHEGYLYGCQFHPEKSGEKGLDIIRCFLSLK